MTRLVLRLEPEVHSIRKTLPGKVRQLIGRAIDNLPAAPYSPQSKTLDKTDLNVPDGVELRRLRIDSWRVIYAINAEEGWVWVLSVRRRPPYAYEDLAELVARLS